MKKNSFLRFMLLFLTMVLALWLTGCRPTLPEAQEERPVSVAITDVAYGDLEVSTTLVGQVEPYEEVRLVPKMPGTVQRVHVSVGDSVTSGQVLVTLDQRDLNNSIRQAEAGLAIAEAGLEAARAGLASVEMQHTQSLRELERVQTLYAQGAVTLQQLEQAEMAASETSLKSARSQVSQAEAQVNQARVAVDIARSSLADTEIISPIDGVVATLNATPGELVTGQGVTAVIAQLDPMKLKTQVSEYLINRFSMGQPVQLRIPSAFPDTETGTVDSIAPVPAQGTMTFPMEIMIPNRLGLIRAGMFAEVQLTVETRRSILIVPSPSVVVREGRTVVFLEENGRAVMKEVILGIDNGQEAEIVYGVNAGDRVVFQGQDFLENGSLLRETDDQGGGVS